MIGILYGALLAVGQKDMSRFVAYTSIAHFGFIALGIFAFSTQAFAGSVLYMVNHGLSTGMLFVMVGLLAARGGSRMIGDYGGVAKLAPVLAGCFLLAGLSSLALPGTNSFVSEFLVLVGSFPREPVFTILATVGIVFAALYVLWVYQQTMQGPVRGARPVPRRPRQRRGRPVAGGPGAMIDPAIAARRAGSGFPDLSVREIAVLVPLIIAILVLGFFPGPVLDVVNPSVAATMTEVGLTDPVGGLARDDPRDLVAQVEQVRPRRSTTARSPRCSSCSARPASRCSSRRSCRGTSAGRCRSGSASPRWAWPGSRSGSTPGASPPGITTIGDALAVDRPTLFLWGTLLALGLGSVLLIADRSVEPGGAFVASAASRAAAGGSGCGSALRPDGPRPLLRLARTRRRRCRPRSSRSRCSRSAG